MLVVEIVPLFVMLSKVPLSVTLFNCNVCNSSIFSSPFITMSPAAIVTFFAVVPTILKDAKAFVTPGVD